MPPRAGGLRFRIKRSTARRYATARRSVYPRSAPSSRGRVFFRRSFAASRSARLHSSRRSGRRVSHGFGRRRLRHRRRKALPAAFAPLGSSKLVRLRYAQTFTLDWPATLLYGAPQFFSANGLYDPDISGVGHQPYGFDTMMSMFYGYVVLGSKMTIKYVGNLVGTDAFMAYGLRASTTAPSTNPDILIEEASTKEILVGNTYHQHRPVTMRFSAKRYFGCPSPQSDPDNYGGAAASNPTEQAYYFIALRGTYGSSSPTPAPSLTVVIDYIALFQEPKILAQS